MRSVSSRAAAKINLALAVGPRRADGLHEVVTVMQHVDLWDVVSLEAGLPLEVTGFDGDTIVRKALVALGLAAGVEPRWRVRLEKSIPLAAGLGGGSADAAAALKLANQTLDSPLGRRELAEVAFGVGSDVAFFLEPGPKLVEGGGERLTPLALPQDYWIVLAVESGVGKRSTADVYARFDEHGGEVGFEQRAASVRETVRSCLRSEDLARFPQNDLALVSGGSALLPQLRAAGSFRADVSGAGPAVYGLFHHRASATEAASALPPETRTWVLAPV